MICCGVITKLSDLNSKSLLSLYLSVTLAKLSSTPRPIKLAPSNVNPPS